MTTTGAVVLLLASSNAFVPCSARPALPGRGVVRAARGAPTALLRGLESIFGAPPRDDIDYAALPGRPASWAREAGAFAVEGAVPARSADGLAVATFAGGCFWGLELAFQRVPGVVATSVGYAMGDAPRPTYKQVCGGYTGHTEAVQLVYDPAACDYGDLCRALFARVNPTLLNRVGNDVGTQYRHGIYTHTAEQAAEAKRVWDAVNEQTGGKVVTELRPAEVYWPAEEYHQQYLAKGGRAGNPQSPAKGCTDTIRCYG